ncbi:chorismate mutase [bacterium]|nr:chorismate mutase [bacterium]MCI0604675.1 chorismate mutase [bacterium]
MIRGVRGAIQVTENEREYIIGAAEELMNALIDSNRIRKEDVSAVFFTVTPELNAAFPAGVRAKLGWDLVPFLCGLEIPVSGALERILRVLILFETDREQEEIRHQYLGGAASLRPDLKRW